MHLLIIIMSKPPFAPLLTITALPILVRLDSCLTIIATKITNAITHITVIAQQVNAQPRKTRSRPALETRCARMMDIVTSHKEVLESAKPL